MLATFQVGNVTTTLGDDANLAALGKLSFTWEEWSAAAGLQKEPTAAALGGGSVYKGVLGNVDRMLGFRIARTLDSLAAQVTFLKTLDGLVGSTGKLVLQPDGKNAAALTYPNAILIAARLVPGGETTRGKFITISYKFECQTLS